MQHLAASLLPIALLAAGAAAQCFEPNLGVLAPRTGFLAGYGDDVMFDLQPMNFAFPMGGVATTYTHAHIQSNGVVFLTNGADSGATTTGYSGTPATQLTNLRGLVGEPPRIAPLWRDLNNLAANGGGVFFNNTIPGKFVVTWSNTVQYGSTAPIFTVQTQLLSTGEIHFFFNGTVASTTATISGVSEGNAVAAVAGVDFTAVTGNSGVSKLMFEQFAANTLDLDNRFIHFAPNVFAGYDQTASDCGAFNKNYGRGCYDLSDSLYQLLPDAAIASIVLTNQSVVWTPAGSQYTAAWGGGVYVPPTAAAVNVFATATDDAEQVLTPTVPFATPAGPQATVRVHSNGLVSWGATAQTFPGTVSYQPTASGFLNGANAGFYAWHDYAENDTGSGRIKWEEATVGANRVLYVTWDDVDSWPLTVANRGTLQFQLNLTTGAVTIVWTTVDNNTSSTFGSAHLVGYTAAGPSQDAGSLDFATALPLTTIGVNAPAMSLLASPSPISTAVAGTVVTYTTADMPVFDPTASPFYIGLNVLSVGQVALGVDLIAIGAPQCRAYISSLDIARTLVGPASTQSVTFLFPPGLPAGFEIYSQSAALFLPGSLPNGQNAAGLAVSNGVRQRVDAF